MNIFIFGRPTIIALLVFLLAHKTQVSFLPSLQTCEITLKNLNAAEANFWIILFNFKQTFATGFAFYNDVLDTTSV